MEYMISKILKERMNREGAEYLNPLAKVADKAGKAEQFHMTEDQIYRVLNFFHQHFSFLQRLDAPTLEEVTRKYAKEIKDYKYHPLRNPVYFLLDELPAVLLFGSNKNK